MARLVVFGGWLVTPIGRRRADVVIEDGRVGEVVEPGTRVEADERLDVEGLLVFPGFIDPHVHSRDPGAPEKEDFSHSTRAAAAGGVTTILEMPNTIPAVADAAVFRERRDALEASAFVDFGMWGLSLGGENLGEIPQFFAEGAVGVKTFWGYALDRRTRGLVYDPRGVRAEDLVLPADVGDMLDVCRAVAEVGGLLGAHCEDSTILRSAHARVGSIEQYEDLLTARPVVAEAASIAVARELARETGCRFHVVHMSSARGAELVREAQRLGISLSAETCPHYLSFTAADYAKIGPLMKVFPPIRGPADREVLWAAVNDGTVMSLGSDHAPHTAEEKAGGLGPAPAGATGVETMVAVMLDAAAAGATSFERLAWALAEGTARLYGLFPRKGTIEPGSDADLTIVDPAADWTVDAGRLHTKQRWSPWSGRRLRGRPVLALLRGEVCMRDGEPTGEPRGRFVRPGARSMQSNLTLR